MENAIREIKVFVGSGLDEEGLKDVLNDYKDGRENTMLFEIAHALLVEHNDSRAEIHSVGVEEVTIDPTHPNQVHIQFTTSWSAYYGCHDMDMAGDEDECESAIYTSDGNLIFMVPVPRRPANHC